MKTHYHAIYLSPHLDDVALSCGGQIKQRTDAGERILIVSVTAGDPAGAGVSDYAQSLHTRWEVGADAAAPATATRRTEDLAACRILGADALHWPAPDCIYRRDPVSGEPLYVSDPEIFGAVQPADLEWVDKLAAWIQELPPADALYVPLTVGHHVDHQLTRRAAERSERRPLVYYEDYPYAQQPEKMAAFFAGATAHWQATSIPLGEAALATKIEAILAYRSQFSTFWRQRAEMEQQVVAYAARVGGERVWRRVTE